MPDLMDPLEAAVLAEQRRKRLTIWGIVFGVVLVGFAAVVVNELLRQQRIARAQARLRNWTPDERARATRGAQALRERIETVAVPLRRAVADALTRIDSLPMCPALQRNTGPSLQIVRQHELNTFVPFELKTSISPAEIDRRMEWSQGRSSPESIESELRWFEQPLPSFGRQFVFVIREFEAPTEYGYRQVRGGLARGIALVCNLEPAQCDCGWSQEVTMQTGTVTRRSGDTYESIFLNRVYVEVSSRVERE